MNILILLRHAKTPFNENGLIQGRLDVELSEEGVKEAETLRKQLFNERFDVVYTSQLKRAYKTAEIILRGRDAEIFQDPRLNEIDQGEWTGRSGKYLYQTNERYRLWATRPMEAHPPGGETFQEVARRALSFLLEIKGRRQLVVAHGGVIAALRSVAGEASLEMAWSLIPANAQRIELSLPPRVKLLEMASILAVQNG